MHEESPRARPTIGFGRHSLALAAFFGVELLVFCIATRIQYSWLPLRWYDQDQYLSEGYNAFEVARLHGFAAGVAESLGHRSPQGALHGFLSLLVFEAVGPSRLAALSLNLMALLVLQFATFCAVVRLSGSRAIAWAAIGVLCAMSCPWSGHWGSATDFRLDWMAACAFGTALCVGIMGGGFRSTLWAVAFGFVVGLVLLLRFLTAVYFCGIFAVLFAWLLSEPDKLRRLGRLIFSAAIAAGVCGWAFWRSRQIIYSYYWTGHFGSPEAAARTTHGSWAESVVWMVNEIFVRQIGLPALFLCIGVAVCFFLARTGSDDGGDSVAQAKFRPKDALILSAAFAAVPTLVLLTHPEKAEPPADLIGPAVLWIGFVGWLALSRRASRYWVARISSVATVIGVVAFGAYQFHQTVTPKLFSEYRDFNALSDFLYFRAQESGLVRPYVSVTWASDSLNADAFRILGYERHGKVVAFAQIFPTSILDQPRDVVMADLARSDFVCVVTRAAVTWPVDRQMASMAPELLRWCGEHMVRDGEIDSAEIAATIFERKNLAAPDLAVSLPEFILAGKSSPLGVALLPPAAPFVQQGAPVLWSSATEIDYVVKVAYSPYTITAVDLPKGVSFDADSGTLRGKFQGPGNPVLKLRATNAVGSSEINLPFRVIEADWTSEVSPAPEARSGEATWLDYSAFDARGTLDFMDITDLTESRVLARLEASDDQHETWHGRFHFVLTQPGTHSIIARTVRYDPKQAAYSYVDRTFSVLVRP